MLLPFCLSMAAAFLLLPPIAASVAQSAPDPSGCTLEGRNWVCHLPDLTAALTASHTAVTISDPSDRASDATMRSLAQSLGLTAVMPAGDAAPADLTFLLTPAERAGVYVGPHQVELALLRIYRNAPGGSRGPLLWAESYVGDPDMPWPTVVRALSVQLRERLKKKR